MITKAVAANIEATDIVLHFSDGSVAAVKPDDPRLVGIIIEPCPAEEAISRSGSISKMDLLRRMTDGELNSFSNYLDTRAGTRRKMYFWASESFDKSDIQWRTAFLTLFGPDRTEQILS